MAAENKINFTGLSPLKHVALTRYTRLGASIRLRRLQKRSPCEWGPWLKDRFTFGYSHNFLDSWLFRGHHEIQS